MRSPRRMHSRPLRRSGEAGAAAAEFALVLPIFLMLLSGTISLGNAVFVRHQLITAATVAARTCVLAKDVTQGCAAGAAQPALQIVNNTCLAPAQVLTGTTPVAGGLNVTLFNVTATCTVSWFPAPGLAELGLTTINLTASSAMPFR